MTRRFLSLAIAAAVAAPVCAVPLLAQSTGDFHWGKALPAGDQVRVENVSGSVKIVPSTSGKVQVVGIRHGHGDLDLVRADVEESPRGIVVCVIYDDPSGTCEESHNRNSHGYDDASIDFEVSVPANLTVSASSVSGDVTVSGAQGDVRATSVSGDVRLDGLRASSVTAQSVSGDVDVRVDQLTGGGDLDFKTVSGDVTLELPSQFDADLSMTTVSGNLDSDYPITLSNGQMNRRRIEARIGKGGRHLQLTTVSGDVRIRKAS